ncbi:substrate-binding domain-containing protein [Actinomyces sp. 186855]|nr:substrate-binding domain-containing protein [Actinomyces sp. AC-20-1]MCL3789648.1 substrate-binding domain-containing protein [Actinomyces sp. 187325]MCL3792187.1 substrate-binding domain-containing protein [Actinomyces sp. 186855]MCL3794819.1 substrate-binding domain-containing protein [Actinomyces sp. 217892]
MSAQTVSRFFNDGYVSADARARIRAAVGQLGYVPNRLPVQLRRASTDVIGVVLFGPLNYGNARIMTGLYRAARELGRTVMTTHMEADPASSSALWNTTLKEVESFVASRVDGLVVASPYASVRRVLEAVPPAVPVVTLAELEDDGRDAVGSYSYTAARAVVEHLLEEGARRVLHVGGPGDRAQSCTRRLACEDVLREAGLSPVGVLECPEWTVQDAARLAEGVEPGSFDAVFAANDDLALGFMSVMRERGLVAPEDYLIAGYDGMPQSGFFAPPLTTAYVDFERIGETALRRVVAQAAGEPVEGSRWSVPTQVLVRESTTRVGRGRA